MLLEEAAAAWPNGAERERGKKFVCVCVCVCVCVLNRIPGLMWSW
jgi:hypothetical protein